MNRIAATGVVLAALMLPGCLTPAGGALPDQYLLKPQVQAQPAEATPLTLGLRELESARPYNLSMAHTDADGKLNYYQTATWAEFPAAAITRSLRDGILKSGRFADTGMAEQLTRPDLMLIGYLDGFHEDRSSTPPQAVAEVRLELRRARGINLIWSATLREVEPITGEGPAALATAMNVAVERLVSKAAEGISTATIPSEDVK
jgi:ABC-type uncharacterized transport system auxiliary subunit